MTLAAFGSQFDLGQIIITPQAFNELSRDEMGVALIRHMSCDWGELDSFDREQNDLALIEGGRLMSRYEAEGGMVFWIITEHDHATTTILLPSDY